ncbi:MAG TPA: 50S ribosomal protein L25 [Gemmataceae bacterium]|nr:50S ribosomal protein L25 [Gemmataceae bacterium]
MADAVQLVTQPREQVGSQAARRLRRKGLVPAVVYGHGEATVSIALPAEEVADAIRHGTHVLDLKTGDAVQKALIKEVQWDHLGKDILHVDFARIAADERIQVTVPLEVRGIAPGVVAHGILDQPMHALEVECLATAIPASIRVNINELQVGQAIHVRDLHLPPDVTPLADPDAIVIHVLAPVAEPEPGVAPLAEQAEPEVIGRKAEEGEEEEK